jgi:hypothetical protein
MNNTADCFEAFVSVYNGPKSEVDGWVACAYLGASVGVVVSTEMHI